MMLAEQGYMQREDNSDPAWQEMLNHATMKVNDAETERHENEKVHQRMTMRFKEAEDLVQRLQRDLKRSINKSKPYFEMKARLNQMMEDRKKTVINLEESVSATKKSYSDALRNLEEISESIHQKRIEMRNQAELGERGSGVGSESPSPPPMRGKDHVSIDGKSAHIVSSCNIGNSGTTVTSAQFSAGSSSHEFRPPSVIYSSPEKARSASYRQAIEARITSEQDLDNISEDMSVNLSDEFMALPRTSSDEADSVFANKNQNNNGDAIHTRHLQSTKPKKPSSKLKGLILTPVSAGFDPLQATLRISSQRATSQVNHSTQRPVTYPYSHNEKNTRVLPLENRSSNLEAGLKQHHPSPVMELRSPVDLPTPGSGTSGRKLLKVPSMQDFDEGSISDNDSITSGTMLDDDQVEFLTMEFSKQDMLDDERRSNDLNFRRLSLPPSLTHLKSHLRQFSEEKIENNQTNTT